MIPSLLVLKCILERRCGVICPKPVQLKESLKIKLISNNLIFHLEISAPSPRGERFLWTGSISVDLTCYFRPSCSKRTFFFFLPVRHRDQPTGSSQRCQRRFFAINEAESENPSDCSCTQASLSALLPSGPALATNHIHGWWRGGALLNGW